MAPDSPTSLHLQKRLDLPSIRALVATVNHHLSLFLADSSSRRRLQQSCAARLSAAKNHHGAHHSSSFSDHSVLSNLFWGLDNLDSAASAFSSSAAAANERLAAAERLLQIPALLDELGTTAGVDNCYLVCCSYFCLALVRKLQGDDWQVTMHFLQALLVSPRLVRAEFAPELCRRLWPGRDRSREGELEEVMRKQGRRYKDWLMYYQVVSYGETPRWIKGCPVAAAGGLNPMYRKCESAKELCFSGRERDCNVSQDASNGVLLHSHHFTDLEDGENINGDKPSIAKLLELNNLDELEEETTSRRLDEGFYQDSQGNFDIRRLQEMLEETQSDTADSFYSQIDSAEGSDIEVKMQDKRSSMVTLTANTEFPAQNFDNRSSQEESPKSSHKCLEISKFEGSRYSMHIQAHGFKTSYLLSSKPPGSINDLNLSILGIRDGHSFPSYQCCVAYTPPERSPAHELRCFGQLPAKLFRRYGFAEVVPHGSFTRRKLNFSTIDKDWTEENSNFENDNQVEFMGRFEKAVSKLCYSEDQSKCRDTGLEVMNVCEMLNNKSEVKFSTIKQKILHQLLDIISTSKEDKFIKASLSILLLLISDDKSLLDDIKRKPSHLCDLARALKTDVQEAAILIHLLKPSPSELKGLELLPSLVEIACNSNGYKVPILLPSSATAASLSLIEILVTAFDYTTNNVHLVEISSPQIIAKLVNIARNKNLEEVIALAGVLVRCMRFSGGCRKFLSQVTPVEPFLYLLRRSEKRAKFAALEYFHEILRMPRSSANVLLHQIRQQGGVSIMYTLMASIQRAQQEHKLLAASLLLQLDLLEDFSGKSIFKEEALGVLTESVASESSSSVRVLSAFILSNIGGTYAWTGEPYTAAWLLKKAGLTSACNRNMVRNIDWRDPCLQDPDMDTWSSRIAKGFIKIGSSVFSALAKGIESNIKSVSRDSLVALAWLVCEMTVTSPSSLRYHVCDMMLSGIVHFLHPGSELDERVLACLCVYNFASGKGMKKLMNFSEGVRESLRRLSSTTWMAEELLKVTDYFIPTKPRVSCVHTQIIEAGKADGGAAMALIFYKGQLHCGYADGTIKVWDIRGQTSKLVCEVKGHKKAVTCFTLCEPGDKLLSGSVDKTVKIWQMLQKKLECVETVEIKESIHKINSHGDKIFVLTQNRGLKVCHASKVMKTVCKNKNIKCLAMAQSKVYLGCADSSIQGIDMITDREQEIKAPGHTWRIQNKPINSIYVYKGWLYSGGSNIEELNVKDWRRYNKPQVSVTTDRGNNVQEMAVVEDFIYLTCSSAPSILQIWLRGKQQKVGRLSAGSKITCLLTANDIVLCGTETGIIKGWIPL